MIFAKNVMLSDVLDGTSVKQAFLLYEDIDLIIIGHFKKFQSDRSHKFHIDYSHKESMSVWFIDVPSGNATSKRLILSRYLEKYQLFS